MPLIADRYETLERIGGGGMADVFRAHDRRLDRDVALKVMRPAFASDAEFSLRFHREAEALGAIDHPNIVRVLDYGTSADGPFLVMELLSGGTLRDLMRARGRVGQYEAAALAAAIADGLEAAHLRGVLHRDLKPDNVLLDDEGRPKIADFGIARLAAATAITRTGEVLGTPQYLAPEQMTGDVVDERADVYALGVILYEMLTGAQPTGGTTPSEIISRRLRVDPRPPSRVVAVTPAMNALVLRALARDPAHRIRRAADMKAGLLAIKPPVPRPSTPRRPLKLQLPSLAPLLAIAVSLVAALRSFDMPAAPHLPHVPMPSLVIPPLGPSLSAFGASARGLTGRAWLAMTSFAARVATAVATFARPAGPRPATATTRMRTVAPPPAPAAAPRRRSPAALLAALALLAAFVGGTLAYAGARTPLTATAPAASPSPETAVLASTSTPAPTAAPTATPEPSAQPEPTAEPTAEPTPAPVVVATPAPRAVAAGGDPAGTIVSFYQLVSGHDYASASSLWSARMRAAYPPQTNIWGRFDSTSSIVTRSASVTNAGPGTAAVAVDLVETMSNGSVRRWVGTWYLVRSGSGWLLDQPGLRLA